MSYVPKVLIVDDDPRMCDSLEALLSNKGNEIHKTNSGREAIEYLTKTAFDLILLDMVMPDINGQQVMNHINSQNLETMVIVLTGHVSIESAIESLRRGAYDYLRKPFEPEELLKTVANALDQQRLRRDCQIAKNALQRSEEWFRNIYEKSPIGIELCDSDGRLLKVNKACLDIFGVSDVEEVKGFDLLQDPNVTDELKERLHKGQTVKYEVALDFEELKKQRLYETTKTGIAYLSILTTPLGVKENRALGGYLLHVQDISKRKLAEEQIMASLREKEVLLREIHHRVKNNMQLVTSLLRIQTEQIKDKQYAEMFQDSLDRIQSISFVHEKLYQSKDLANVDFNGYVKSLVSFLFRSHGVDPNKIAPRIEVEDLSFSIETAIPCGLLINELVSNSLKHAFPEERKGEIRIVLRSINEDELELEFSDDGIGMPEELDFTNTESMGLDLIKILGEDQLDGKIELDRIGGTKFHIRIKRQVYKPRI